MSDQQSELVLLDSVWTTAGADVLPSVFLLLSTRCFASCVSAHLYYWIPFLWHSDLLWVFLPFSTPAELVESLSHWSTCLCNTGPVCCSQSGQLLAMSLKQLTEENLGKGGKSNVPLTCNYHLCPQWPLCTGYSLPLKQGSVCHTGACLLGRSIPGAHTDELQLVQRDPLKSTLYFTSSQLVLWFDWRLTLTQWLEESGSAQLSTGSHVSGSYMS